MRDQVLNTLALTLVPGLGRKRLKRLLDHYQDPGAVLKLTRAEMKRFRLSYEMHAFIASGCALKEAEEMLARCRKLGIRVMCRRDEDYPEALSQIHDPPAALYLKGDASLLSRAAIAIVGARRATVYGRQITRKLARDLASHGLAVVSGMARGADSQAHWGCLEAGGKTVAVLGNGVDVVYPKENRRLYDEIAENGCVASEFPCGESPVPQNFPVRNRIISGLSAAVLVTEADRHSGSLITARLAGEQGRDVMAVPGNVTSRYSQGANDLIRQGAGLVQEFQDVLEALPQRVLKELRKGLEEPPEKPLREEGKLSGAAKEILKLLPVDDNLLVDLVADRSGRPAAEVNQILLELEVRGKVRRWPGPAYSRRL